MCSTSTSNVAAFTATFRPGASLWVCVCMLHSPRPYALPVASADMQQCSEHKGLVWPIPSLALQETNQSRALCTVPVCSPAAVVCNQREDCAFLDGKWLAAAVLLCSGCSHARQSIHDPMNQVMFCCMHVCKLVSMPFEAPSCDQRHVLSSHAMCSPLLMRCLCLP